MDHDDWIADIFSSNLGGLSYHPFLVSMSSNGILRFSSVLREERVIPMQSFSVSDKELRLLSCSIVSSAYGLLLNFNGFEKSQSAKTLLVISSEYWMVSFILKAIWRHLLFSALRSK